MCLMHSRPVLIAAFVCAAFLSLAASARADVFNMPSGSTSLSFVSVGDPNNPPDTTVMVTDGTTGYGSVSYVYQMGKYDVTLAQYTQFLNAVAKTDPYGLYNSYMANGEGEYPFGVSQSGSPGSYSYSVTGSNPQVRNMPMTCVTWGDAARFCNWLDNAQPTAAEGNGTTETGAYALNGDTTNLLTETRNPGRSTSSPAKTSGIKPLTTIRRTAATGPTPRRATPRRATRCSCRPPAITTPTITSAATPTRRTT